MRFRFTHVDGFLLEDVRRGRTLCGDVNIARDVYFTISDLDVAES